MEDGYGHGTNYAVLDLVPPNVRCLDIGCGEGGWGNELRAKGVTRLVGIEADPALAKKATAYDEVVVGRVEELDLASLGEFDLVVAADVLEHLTDPWSVLSRLRTCLAPGGQLLVSVPNARCIEITGPLLVKGRFDYDDQGGLMDRGHLRWFTRRTLAEDLVAAGWRPTTWRFVTLGTRRPVNRVLERLNVLPDLLARQFVVLASPI
jgi:2-polyprenyl-3-methyl-5-hydroxy-6-metoxy-1,4-benzoquinol methylase